MRDVIVVGARCAGAATAMLLARAGLDVLLVDRDRVPSDAPRGHFVHGHGMRRLAQWGTLDLLLEAGTPAITSFHTDFGDFVLEGEGLELDGIPVGIGPRRGRLDAILAGQAAAAGAEVRDRFVVEELLWDGPRVTGVRGRGLDGGGSVAERARLVVGADGRSSLVARQVGAPMLVDRPTVTGYWWTYWDGIDLGPTLRLTVRDRRAVFAFPTDEGRLGVFVGFPSGEAPTGRDAFEPAIRAAVELIPPVAEQLRGRAPAERIYGARHLPNFVRAPHGPGWALAGDAACHKDPLLALGVRDALRDADWLAEAALDGRPQAWGAYAARRHEELPEFERNFAGAHLQGVPPELLAARAAVRGDARATREFYLAAQRLREPAPA